MLIKIEVRAQFIASFLSVLLNKVYIIIIIIIIITRYSIHSYADDYYLAPLSLSLSLYTHTHKIQTSRERKILRGHYKKSKNLRY